MISNSTNVSVNNNNTTNLQNRKNSTAFKGVASTLLNIPGQAMNGIEQGGFVASFLIQDTLGMTTPRTAEGLHRDRDKNVKFKDMNFKEAGEVFIREFLSGPILMFTPYLVFALTRKHIGKSTFTNTSLLKGLGKTFTESVKGKASDATAKTVKNKFYKDAITKFVEHTTPSVKGSQKATDFVDKLYGHVTKIDELESQVKTAKGKSFKDSVLNIFRKKADKVVSEKDLIKSQLKEHKASLTSDFNEFHTSNSDNLSLVNKVKLDNDAFGTDEAFKAMRDYAHDATHNKDVSKITEDSARALEKTSMAKRIFSTVAASAGTIGAVSVVPKLYALLNPVAPSVDAKGTGAKPAQQATQSTQAQAKPQDNKQGNNVAFKGNILKNLQFNGNQLTPMLMSTLAMGGLLAPRVSTAVKRAPIDPDTGKKNLIEVPEILTRDVISTLAVTFGVPLLSKAMVSAYEKKSGFVLKTKPEKEMSTTKKVLDMLNPISSITPYSNKDLKEIYGNVTTKDKLTNFASFIDKNGGDLSKVFKTLHKGEDVFKGTEAAFDTLPKGDRAASNSKIMNAIKNFKDADVVKLMTPKKAGKANEMLLRARTLNSIPSFMSTLILVPVFLGMVLPKIVYGITAKNRKKQEAAKNGNAQQVATAPAPAPAQQPVSQAQNSMNVSAPAQNPKVGMTFERLKH